MSPARHSCPSYPRTHAFRAEGFFRLEVKLAVDRFHLIAAERPFIVPVIIDGVQEPLVGASSEPHPQIKHTHNRGTSPWMRSVTARRWLHSLKSMPGRRLITLRFVPGRKALLPLDANRGADSVALRWTQSAYADLRRMYDFLEPVDPGAANRAVRLIFGRIERIPAQPRLGERLPRFGSRDVRRVLAAKYEIRYEVTEREVVILRIFHTREDR